MSVVIKSSKTDQYQQGDAVPVARTGTATCPVKMMEHYYELGEIAHGSSLPLFSCSYKHKAWSAPKRLLVLLAIPKR